MGASRWRWVRSWLIGLGVLLASVAAIPVAAAIGGRVALSILATAQLLGTLAFNWRSVRQIRPDPVLYLSLSAPVVVFSILAVALASIGASPDGTAAVLVLGFVWVGAVLIIDHPRALRGWAQHILRRPIRADRAFSGELSRTLAVAQLAVTDVLNAPNDEPRIRLSRASIDAIRSLPAPDPDLAAVRDGLAAVYDRLLAVATTNPSREAWEAAIHTGDAAQRQWWLLTWGFLPPQRRRATLPPESPEAIFDNDLATALEASRSALEGIREGNDTRRRRRRVADAVKRIRAVKADDDERAAIRDGYAHNYEQWFGRYERAANEGDYDQLRAELDSLNDRWWIVSTGHPRHEPEREGQPDAQVPR